jgi:hypothetical protein
MKRWGTISIILFVFMMGCATKGTLNVREVRPHVQSDSHHQISENESLVFGRILATFNDSDKFFFTGLWGGGTTGTGVIVTDLSGEKFSRRLQFTNLSNNKYFFWAFPQGSYRIMSISVPLTSDFIEPTPITFDVPDVGKAYYLGDLTLDLKGKRYLFIRNRLEEISKLDVVDNYVEATDYLLNKNSTFENRIEKLLMKKDDQDGIYDTKFIKDSDSKYYKMQTSSEEAGNNVMLVTGLIFMGCLTEILPCPPIFTW